MENEVKQYQSEDVRQKARNASGAWINGSEMKEKGTATQPKANSDHGNFSQNKGVDKRNA